MATSNLNIRMDKDIKEQADQIFTELGLTMTAAVNLFLRASIREQGIPFSVKLNKVNKETIAAIEEGRKIAKDPNAKGYHSVDELKKALELWLNMKFVLPIALKKILNLQRSKVKDLDKLFKIIEKLAQGKTLEAKYRDHSLTGDYKGTRECHIEPDWLLIYEIFEDVLVLSLQRIGSHSDLF